MEPEDLDPSVVWVYAIPGSGKTHLGWGFKEHSLTVLETDFFYINNHEVIKRDYPQLEALWNHKFDVLYKDKIVGALDIGGFLDRCVNESLGYLVASLFVQWNLDDLKSHRVSIIEGWMPEPIMERIVELLKEQEVRVWLARLQ